MSKYDRLSDYLSAVDPSRSPLRMSFEQIEQVMREPLPPSARTYQAWWANQSERGHSQTRGWASAGWRTSELDLEGETVTFRYAATRTPAAMPESPSNSSLSNGGITIDEAKRRLAISFGVSPENIEIVIRG